MVHKEDVMKNTMYRRRPGLILCKHYKVCFTFLALIAILYTNCSVAPVLESPRVRSGVIVEATAKHAQSHLTWNLSDTVLRNSAYSNELKFEFGDEDFDVAPVVKFAFANRVEFGGYLMALLQNKGWDGSIKVALFDIGEPYFFRNVAAAALIGSTGFNGEWDECSRNWAGLSLGTYHQFGMLGIEYILMPTAGKSSYSNLDDPHGSGGVYFYDITLVTGIKADINQKFFSSFALTAMKKFTSHYEINNYSNKITINRISFGQDPVGFNFVIGYRFGSRKD
jgi:hypothetical protein